MHLRFALAVALFSAILTACGGSPADESPVDTVRHFLEVMDRSAVDERALVEAFRMLDAPARAALALRAERASTLAGRRFEPWQMLAQGRFRLRFAPAPSRGMRERIDGERAIVMVHGSGAGEYAEIPLVRAQGRWRIVLPIPPIRSEAKSSVDGSPPGEG